MEQNGTDEPQIKKRKRTISNIQVAECIREFKLPQTYPSMVSQSKKTPVNVTVERIKMPGSQPTLNLKVSSGKIDPNNKLQKLKLKAPDGRDLGEFDVQVLPSGNKDSKTVSVAVNQVRKEGETSNLKPEDRKISTINISTAGLVNTLKNPSMPSMKYIKKYIQEAKTQNSTPTHGVLIPISPVLINQKNHSNEKGHMIDSDGNVKNSKVYVMPTGESWQMIKQTHDGKKMIEPVNPTALKVNGLESMRNGNSKSYIGPLHAGMKVKIINRNSKQNSEVMINGRKRLKSSDESENSGKRLYSSLPMSSRMDSSGRMILENLEKGNLGNKTYQVLPSKDRMSLVEPSEKKTSGNVGTSTSSLRNSLGRVNLIRKEKKDPNAPSRSDCDSSNNPFSLDQQSDKNDDVALEDTMDELSILGKALNSLSNEELKRKALKALTECGIGFEKLIPKKAPLDQTSIRESQTQTQIFSLLRENEFVKVSKDSPTLETIPVREKQNPEAKRSPFSEEDLDEMLEAVKWDVDKEKMKQVQNIMKFNPMSERLYKLLENDFCNVKKYDENGRLNIHRAVLNNHLAGVKRQLMILKACNISIDIATEDDQTSLELAVKYNARDEIISLLLRSGAKPTSSKHARDSALTIASQQSSALIPVLIKHTPKSGDLNYLDSNGFAAIHYCAQNGNWDGAMALITANADLNIRDNKSGRTALFHALENDDLKLAKELLTHGAKPNIPNFSSHTVFNLIDDTKHVCLKEMLTKAMKT